MSWVNEFKELINMKQIKYWSLALALIFIVLSSLDDYTTHLSLSTGKAREINPFYVDGALSIADLLVIRTFMGVSLVVLAIKYPTNLILFAFMLVTVIAWSNTVITNWNVYMLNSGGITYN